MKIEVKRKCLKNNATTGDLFVDGQFECHTLEDVVRKPGVKVWGATAIPAGVYAVIVSMSPRFKKFMPRLLDVPGFDGILIHSGNTGADTHGCILVGYKITDKNTIAMGTSRAAYDSLFLKIENAIKIGEQITIEIINEFPEEVVE